MIGRCRGRKIEALERIPNDIVGLRVEQARLLKERVFSSCLIVEFIISYTSLIMLITGPPQNATIWFGAGSIMVAITYFYAKFSATDGINRENVSSYLRGHIIVTGLTGAVWGAFAIYQIEFESEFSIFIACLLVSSITMGGVLPSSIYRPGYVALSLFSVVPLGIYLGVQAPGALRLVGLGIIAYFAFAMFISARVELDTRETISAKKNSDLTDELLTQNELVRQANDEKNRFLAATGHDLSQPLHAQGFFMEALHPLLEKSEQIELLGKIQDSWRSQKELLQGIVDIARIDSGAIIPRQSNVALLPVAQQLAQEFQSDQSKIHVLNTHFENAYVKTDPVLLARILRNILSNARRYTPAGGIVDFEIRSHNGDAVLVINDDGPGIPADQQQSVFEEYVQLDGDQNRGLGLGLSIVRKLSKLLDIRLDMDSSPDKGTRFTLRIAELVGNRPGPLSPAAGTDEFKDRPLVVLVDDEVAILESMSTALTAWNCAVVAAASSAEAIRLVGETNATPALLIIDKRIAADEDGLELIQTLREEVNETTPAILMSGDLGKLTDENLEPDIRFMNKPVDPGELHQLINEILIPNENLV